VAEEENNDHHVALVVLVQQSVYPNLFVVLVLYATFHLQVVAVFEVVDV
jgi:hypothetical protein